MQRQQREYQISGVNRLAGKVSMGKKKIVFQLATGGGKTVAFAGLVDRFLTKQQKKILILVHREELLKQAYSTIYNWYEIVAFPVTANNNYLANTLVYIAMVETAYNRLSKNPDYFGNIGMVIVDECHLGNFKKAYKFFPDALIIGFTATPISSSKKDPLKNHFEDIVCCVDIPELIDLWRKDPTTGLVPNRTFHIANINRKELEVNKSTGEFDERQMGNVFSSGKHIQNCLKAYQDHALHTKTLIFNCNIDHSQKVNELFLTFGYQSRHLDGNATDQVRKATLKWFRETPNAILNNVGILTAGFDEPSIQTVIINRSTMSLPLWLQMTGRGSRPYQDKKFFNIVDMGGNAYYHGDWSEPRDWADIFFNPEKPKPPGEAPLKACVGCGVLIPLSTNICSHCGANNYKPPEYDKEKVSISQYSSEKKIFIDVPGLIKKYDGKTKANGTPYKDVYVLHEIKRQIIGAVRGSWRVRKLDAQTAKHVINIYRDYVKQWCLMKGKVYNSWHQTVSREWMEAEFKRIWNWEPNKNIKA